MARKTQNAPAQVVAMRPRAGSGEEFYSWLAGVHLSPILGLILPLAHLAAPGFLWWRWQGRYPLLARQAKEVVNFQLAWTLYLLAATLLLGIGVGYVLLLVVPVLMALLACFGAWRGWQGQLFFYPLTLRLWR